jgi:alkaline phosphatase D
VSDLAWLGIKKYDPKTGKGAIGAEFAGTAVSSWGTSGSNSIEPEAGKLSRKAIAENKELFWQEGYYRGYFHLSVTPKNVSAQFFGKSINHQKRGIDMKLTRRQARHPLPLIMLGRFH